MIREFNGMAPRIAKSAFISEAAYVVGDVEIGEDSNVFPGAVIRGDFGRISIGSNTSVEDNCVIHSGTPSSPMGDVHIGDMVLIGHGAVLNCRKIGSSVLIGMNATILHDVEIGDRCIIGAGCLVSQGMKIPDDSFVAGVPGRIRGKPSEQQLWWVREGSKGYVELARQYRNHGL
ncbi:MAG: gamma carbonic anhydrase family protein [Deltaproteobacteria bacterium]|nr:gamma carbonic anhydrase family protein [Deltaproteobacteria bacterium]MBW2048466.1 gamma carbonic anhydrase family protein [Deltaproteobacteria bacterium]MBW2111053.1 gamma carbonic anhydrase family protein [Deltaproteobacteria bacterium]MBW2353014.1 gamma carbonic anhydrase family protein [Deltaproteobacteria bacterium]